MSRKVITGKYVFLAVLFVASINLLYSSEIGTRDSFPLLIPEPQVEKQSSSDEYVIAEPGEFADVDLPDNIKYKKHEALIMAEVNDDLLPLEQTQQALKYYSIQVAMFKHKANAEKLKAKLLSQFYRAEIVQRVNSKGVIRYDVRFGQYKHRRQAEKVLMTYKAATKSDAYIIVPK